MNEQRPSRDEREEVLASLFRHAETRTRPPEGDERAVRQALHAEWREMTGRRKWRRTAAGLAAAAGLALAASAAVLMMREPALPSGVEVMARVVKKQGEVWVDETGRDGRRAIGDGPLKTGQTVYTETGSSILLEWAQGESVRVGAVTRLTLTSPGEIRLHAGKLYVDSGATGGRTGLVIDTPAGKVRHLGTQYLTVVYDEQVRVAVREGRVSIADGAGQRILTPGEQASLRNGGQVVVSSVASYGGPWGWVEEISPPFLMDGRSISDLLNWVARETGRKVRYQNEEARRLAYETVMRGSVDLPPMRALDVVLATSDLDFSVRGGEIEVSAIR